MKFHRTGGGFALSREREVVEQQMNLEGSCNAIRAIRFAWAESEKLFSRQLQNELNRKREIEDRLTELSASRFQRTNIKPAKQFKTV